MITTASLLGLPGEGVPLRVLGPDHAGRVTVTRAGSAMVQDASGTWRAAAADTPRFHGTARRLLVEAARTNSFRNPRCEGAVAGTLGSGGALPANWLILGSPAVARTVIGTGTEEGIPYVDLRLQGTGSGNFWALCAEPTTQVPASPLQSWSTSFHARILSGSTAGLTLSVTTRYRNSVGGSITVGATPLALGGSRLAVQRSTNSFSNAPTGTAFVTGGIEVLEASGSAIDVTLRIGAPQLELGEVATSPILPAAGAPAAASRAADAPAWIPAEGLGMAGTLVIGAMLPNSALFGVNQGLLQIDDGTDANRLLIRNTSGGSEIFGVVDSGGATLAALSGGSMTPGVPFRAVLAWAPGEVAFCLNGGAVQSAAVTPPAGLLRMLVGHASTALNRAANGEVALIDHRPLRLPNAMLQAASAAG